MEGNKSSILNNAFIKNFSNNAELDNDINDEQLRKTIKEQKDKHEKELEPLLTSMKKKWKKVDYKVKLNQKYLMIIIQ